MSDSRAFPHFCKNERVGVVGWQGQCLSCGAAQGEACRLADHRPLGRPQAPPERPRAAASETAREAEE